jgi:prephenate dehydrogenase
MKKPLFNNITIVSVGLIGGSLGLAIKKRKLAQWVIGVSRRRQTLIKAVEKKAIDIGTMDLKEGVACADLVILCGPIPVIIQQLRMIKPFLKKGAITMDVASSKVEVNKAAKNLLKNNTFIGCHPMAGSEKSGVDFASADLFENALCYITKKNSLIEKFWTALGSKSYFIDAARHDSVVAQVSHIPHILSFALFENINSKKDIPTPVTNPSILEMARLAKSDPVLWAGILLSNRASLLLQLRLLEKNIHGWSKSLKHRDARALENKIASANQKSYHLT